MAEQKKQTAFELLDELSRRSIKYASPLPQKSEIKQTWDGIGFRLGKERFIAPLDQVNEILTYLPITEVPGAKEWVKGIANVRGNLLAISDFSGFVMDRNTKYTHRSQILVVNHKDVQSGLVVDEVYGLRHFFNEDFSTHCTVNEEGMQKFIKGSYSQGEDVWPVVDIYSIVEQPEFKQVAM